MIDHRLLAMLQDYAGFLPGLLVATAISVPAAPLVGRRMGASPAVGWALVMSLGLVLAATLTPSREALLFGAHGTGRCDLTDLGPGSWWDLTHLDENSLNVLLFIPLGLSIGLCPPSRARLLAAWGIVLLPVLIEATQLVVVDLDRQCQVSDIVGNLLGAVVGLAAGRATRALLASAAARTGSPGGLDR